MTAIAPPTGATVDRTSGIHTFSLTQRRNWSQVVAHAVVEFVEEYCAPLCQEAGYSR
jgi:hypothetical protein